MTSRKTIVLSSIFLVVFLITSLVMPVFVAGSPATSKLPAFSVNPIGSGESYSFVLKWGSKGTGNGQFDNPSAIAIDSKDNVYVVEVSNRRVQKFDSNGNFITKWGSYGFGNGQFAEANGIAIDSKGIVYVGEMFGGTRIQKFDSNGNFVGKWGGAGTGNGQFDRPSFLAVDSKDNVYVADCYNNRVQKFDSNGNFITKWGTQGYGNSQFDLLVGIAVDSKGYVYAADYYNNRIQKFDSNGNFITKWGSGGTGDGQFTIPYGIAIDSKDNVYVADGSNNRIQKFDSNGNFITKWGSGGTEDGQFKVPYGVAVDSQGNVYVVDCNNNRIQKFAPSTTATTPAQTKGTSPFDGFWPKTKRQHTDNMDSGYSAESDITFSTDAEGVTRAVCDALGATKGKVVGRTYDFEYAIVNGVPSGRATFTLSEDGKSFTGTFSDNAGHRGNWSGSRSTPTTTPTPAPSGVSVCTQPPAGLVSWWPAEGTTKDVIGGNSGTLIGEATFPLGNVGSGFGFDGNGDAVSLGNPANLQLQNFTIEAWARRENTTKASLITGVGVIFGYGYSGYAFGLLDDGRLFLTKVGIDDVDSNTIRLTDTNFHHVAVTKSGSTVVFYIDGVAETASAYNSSFTFTSKVAIGARGDNFTSSFMGQIDELAVYNRALSGSEIQAIFAAGSAGKCKVSLTPTPTTTPTPAPTTPATTQAGLVGYWNFNEGSGTIARDSSGNGYDGTISGATWATGKVGGALSFDGNADSIKLPHTAMNGLNDITFSFWIKTTSNKNNSIISGANYTTDNEFLAVIYPTSGIGYLVIKNKDFMGKKKINDGLWHFIAMVRVGSSGAVSIYVDGQLDGSGLLPTGKFIIESNGLWIGRDQDSVGGGWETVQDLEGYLDEVRIYNYAQTQSEIQNDMNKATGVIAQSTPTTTPTPTTTTPTTTTIPTGTTLSVEERTVAPNSTVTIPIRLEKASKLGSLNFSLRYDPSVLKVSRVEGGDLVGGSLFQASTREAGIIRCGVVSQGGISVDGPVAHVVFTASGTRGSQSALTMGDIMATDTGGARLSLSLRHGRVTIAAKLKGDYDGDGKITAKDSLAALQMSIGELTEDLNLDMDNDGRVTADDVWRIMATALG